MYKIVFTKQAYRSLRKTPQHVVAKIRKNLDRIANDPFASHPNVTKLQKRPGFRIRVGDWRVIYTLQENKLVILVLKIGPRGGIYR